MDNITYKGHPLIKNPYHDEDYDMYDIKGLFIKRNTDNCLHDLFKEGEVVGISCPCKRCAVR